MVMAVDAQSLTQPGAQLSVSKLGLTKEGAARTLEGFYRRILENAP